MERFNTRFLESTGAYAPNLVGAIIALLIGIAIAFILAAVTRRLAARTQLDEKIARAVRGREATEGLDSARWMSRGVFWVVILVALLAFFQALGFTPITAPLTRAFDLAIGFLPRLLAAAALAVVAWIVASALRLLVNRLLDAAKLDQRLMRKATVADAAAAPRVSRALGQTSYWLTWLLFLPAILGALQLEGILGPVQGMVDKILGFLPNVLTAAAIIIVAVFVGRILGGLITSLLAALGVDRLADRFGMTSARAASASGMAVPRIVPSRLLGNVATVIVVLFAATEAFDVIAFEQLSVMTADILVLVGRVALGLIIFGAGWALAAVAANAIRSSSASPFLASAARVAILVLAGAMALRQMGFANEIISIGFGLLLGGIAAAVAIAFGVGGRGVAARELERWVERAHQREPVINATGAPAH